MRVRSVLIVTALLSSLLGAVVAYLVLTVPNDLAADTMLKAARKDIAAGDNAKARQELSRIVQQYPRTDAAAAATVALVTLEDAERQKLATTIEQLRRDVAARQKESAGVAERVAKLESTPPPAPVVVKTPPPKPAPKKKATTTRRRRR